MIRFLPRIFGQMVCRNEASRYLDAVLAWHMPLLDGIHVYDDRSDDDSVELALAHSCEVTRRPTHVPAFLSHEGRFRDHAWRSFEDTFRPTQDDWVLSFDADEFLISGAATFRHVTNDDRKVLMDECVNAAPDVRGLLLQIPEVFALDPLQVRVDGYWGGITAPRLFRYQPLGTFQDTAMGCGAEPTYVADSLVEPISLKLMHYGYADPVDRHEKYLRYSSLSHGAASAGMSSHVQSIPADGRLETWIGPRPVVWRGRR